MQSQCVPCAAGATAAAMPVPSVVTTAQYQHRPAFNPFGVTENVQQAVMTQPVVAQPVTVKKMPTMVMPTSYFHNEDYTSLVGQLHYNPRNDTWRLRYATVDVSDVFGGSVTLIDAGGMMRGLKSGQMVAVEGEVCDLDSTSVSPSYKVRRIWPVNQ